MPAPLSLCHFREWYHICPRRMRYGFTIFLRNNKCVMRSNEKSKPFQCEKSPFHPVCNNRTPDFRFPSSCQFTQRRIVRTLIVPADDFDCASNRNDAAPVKQKALSLKQKFRLSCTNSALPPVDFHKFSYLISRVHPCASTSSNARKAFSTRFRPR